MYILNYILQCHYYLSLIVIIIFIIIIIMAIYAIIKFCFREFRVENQTGAKLGRRWSSQVLGGAHLGFPMWATSGHVTANQSAAHLEKTQIESRNF